MTNGGLRGAIREGVENGEGGEGPEGSREWAEDLRRRGKSGWRDEEGRAEGVKGGGGV